MASARVGRRTAGFTLSTIGDTRQAEGGNSSRRRIAISSLLQFGGVLSVGLPEAFPSCAKLTVIAAFHGQVTAFACLILRVTMHAGLGWLWAQFRESLIHVAIKSHCFGRILQRGLILRSNANSYLGGQFIDALRHNVELRQTVFKIAVLALQLRFLLGVKRRHITRASETRCLEGQPVS